MRVEAVIFDLDNTLINRKLAFRNYTRSFIEQFINVSGEEQIENIMEYIRIADLDGYRDRKDLFEYLRVNCELKKSNTNLDELLGHWFSEFFKCTILMDGTMDLLNNISAHNIKLGLITNGSVFTQNAKIDQVGIRRFFDTIIISDEVKVKKPDAAIFMIALDLLQTKAEHSWYIGDHPLNDVKGARDAGLNAVWFRGFIEWDQNIKVSKYIIDKLCELEEIIFQ
ncbi:haloacid dehalogenase [Paenibacillus baekrokdamisoli]|uniref:Haloacid dehalogenase n=1 Tax=Paenibacillus baekrokdamisoli TaxID=1712516 RepID=A0A3G9IUK1_9BACL|nr:HAD family hydrolase [Paenibacillus baekrokdamisoli]MBB3071546.1 putative hydrolase of the HAD superfamily [Paenibacillus baekrokdamisoli]BBH21942.1 haloacid dehalogenase [Paenibacillus baekrokdamisoli]